MQSKLYKALLGTWKETWKFLWMLFKSSLPKKLFISYTIFNVVISIYIILLWNCLNSKLLVIFFLVINAIPITVLYKYSQTFKLVSKAKKNIIETAFSTIHNGPLQTLDRILRIVRSQDLSITTISPELEIELEQLNQELRGIYEFWQQETLTTAEKLYLGNQKILNLQDPLHELLYQVYLSTLERDFTCFKTIKLKIRNFEPVDESNFTIENKRGICRFLEEALCNVGKYATGVTCLKVTFSLSVGWYTLSIIDDGFGVNSSKEGRGTQQFKNLAQQMHGKFQRIPIYPQGTICELSWPE